MKKYQYQIIRYMHDRVTNEFVNVGIVLYQPESKFLKAKTITKYGRISSFFGEVNGSFLLKNLKQFEKEISAIHAQMNVEIGAIHSDGLNLESVTFSVLPKDDSALYCTELKEGIDISGDAALTHIYNRLVGRYNKENPIKLQSDEDVWRKVYKEFFDSYDITPRLKPHSVQTENDTFDFERAWKNGSWHCFQTLNFNLKKDSIIKDKAYKWSAILDELDTTDESIHVYLLTTLPNNETGEFVEKKLSQTHKNVVVSVVTETNIREVAKEIQKEVKAHESSFLTQQM